MKILLYSIFVLLCISCESGGNKSDGKNPSQNPIASGPKDNDDATVLKNACDVSGFDKAKVACLQNQIKGKIDLSDMKEVFLLAEKATRECDASKKDMEKIICEYK